MSQIYEEAPMPGMQLTIALTALGTTGVLLGSFAANQGTQLERQLKKIARWVDECSEQTKKERFSRGGARAVESAAGAFQSWMKEQKRDMAWEWGYLDITLHTLARAITEPGDDTAELAWPGYALMSDIIYGGKQ